MNVIFAGRRAPSIAALLICMLSMPAGSEELPLTRDVPIQEFQNKHEEQRYDFNSAPEGIFRSIEFAESFEEEVGFRRTHEIVPVSTTDVFRPDAPAVFVVFSFFQHLDSFQVFAQCYPEHVEGLDPQTMIAHDAMYIALEDDSGYLKLSAPKDGWKPGQYRVEIHVGWQVNEISLVGTMRFNVAGG
jgi:hypothetical protein